MADQKQTDCVILDSEDGKWKDVPCNEKHKFLCKKSGGECCVRLLSGLFMLLSERVHPNTIFAGQSRNASYYLFVLRHANKIASRSWKNDLKSYYTHLGNSHVLVKREQELRQS